MNKWIDAKKHPDKDGRYLAYFGNIFIAHYSKSANKWEHEYIRTGLPQIVSYWMPLPEPPKK